MKRKAKTKKVKKISKPKKVKAKPKPRPKSSKSKRGRAAKVESLKGLKLKSVAAAICSYLTDKGFDPVLTGPACASIYGGADIRSNDIDFVISEYVVDEIERAMKKLGFFCKVYRTFGSKELPFSVSFLPPPLTVGDDIVHDFNLMKTPKGELRTLTPTDCVRQRLATFYRFGYEEALHEAVIVAKKHDIDLDLIASWSKWEWAYDRYEDFVRLLNSND